MNQKIVWNPADLLGSPMFAPLKPVMARLPALKFPGIADWNHLLVQQPVQIAVGDGHPLRFIEQVGGPQAFESQYEPRCYLSGEVQTRPDNWHDFFNALVWLTFPHAKAALNRRHYQALLEPARNPETQRGRTRDVATLLDESGVLIACAEPDLARLICDFSWKSLFWQNRERVNASMGFYILGHGLYEKAMQPYLGMTGQGLLIPVRQEFFSWELARRLHFLDQLAAEYVTDPKHCREKYELQPVPLLGVPGWAAENEQETYYDNANYFRSGRQQYRREV